ncbi:ATP-dependent DNA helicase RecG [Trebonia sp.]|uniref:ATP-dependent DNA helicase RecG n=1 Tax=Trebonia sp. TaxID=2767075 RepID=UPI00261ACDD1|nr:ATP-dependent DNA helicase RecG [Trebonia sp.]
MTTLRDPLIRPLGRRTSDVFESVLGLRTVGDLLRHYPRRYYTRGELTGLAGLRENDHVTVLARVAQVRLVPMRGPNWRQPKGRPLRPNERAEVIVTDGTAILTLTFFAKAAYHVRQLQPGTLGLFAGTVSAFRGRRQLVHPEYELLPDAYEDHRITAELAAEYATELIPIYPASAKLSSWAISRSIQVILDTLDAGEDPLPEDIRQKYRLWPRETAIRAIHRPHDRQDLDHARKRLKWDEAFVMQAALAQRRLAAAAMPAVPRPPVPDGIAAAFDASLPFTLTEGQRLVGEVITRDLSCAYPMHRLLQGEVGSGKTVVAVRAMLQVVDAGGQAALLAPTEVLAQQHYRSITQLLGPLASAGQLGGAEQATRVALLTGSTGRAARRSALSDVFTGDAGILIGTHALLENSVQFADLGLVVIDEQHRFGVEQRDALREKGSGARPHVLVMTATPIPRTVAMTVFGDLEVSTLAELPVGRLPVVTHVVPAAERPRYLERAWERIREEVAAGRQAYVVCPRIGGEMPGADAEGESVAAEDIGDASARDSTGADESALDGDAYLFGGEAADGAAGADFASRRPPLAVLDVAPELAEGPLSGLRVGIMHGRLSPDEKDQVMTVFADGGIDVLVATTVIEVGVDVPNATTMVIMDAERFGVSQLHQLRGRIGRGEAAGLCLLVTEAPEGSPSRDRVDGIAATSDGFRLSRLDLQQRREGDVLGAAQAGRHSSLKMLRLLSDEELIAFAREEASALIAADPQLTGHAALSQAIDDMLGPQRAEFLDKA